MSLTDDDVRHVATLARLGLEDAERRQLAGQLDVILEHISRLNAVDTSSVAETAQVSGLVNVWRDDIRAESLPVAAALANARLHQGSHFQVGAIQE